MKKIFDENGNELDISNFVGSINLEKVSRIELIDKNGRVYVNNNVLNKVQLSFQDDDRTLKIFVI